METLEDIGKIFIVAGFFNIATELYLPIIFFTIYIRSGLESLMPFLLMFAIVSFIVHVVLGGKLLTLSTLFQTPTLKASGALFILKAFLVLTISIIALDQITKTPLTIPTYIRIPYIIITILAYLTLAIGTRIMAIKLNEDKLYVATLTLLIGTIVGLLGSAALLMIGEALLKHS